jgi:hypothetical protein
MAVQVLQQQHRYKLVLESCLVCKELILADTSTVFNFGAMISDIALVSTIFFLVLTQSTTIVLALYEINPVSNVDLFNSVNSCVNVYSYRAQNGDWVHYFDCHHWYNAGLGVLFSSLPAMTKVQSIGSLNTSIQISLKVFF